MPRKTPEGPRAIVCKGCGETFYVERISANASRLYCDVCLDSPERQAIRRWGYARRARERYLERQAQRMERGQWSLSYDPWQTGQLPESVLRNALV